MALIPGLHNVNDIRTGPYDGPRNGEDGINHPTFHAVVYLQVRAPPGINNIYSAALVPGL